MVSFVAGSSKERSFFPRHQRKKERWGCTHRDLLGVGVKLLVAHAGSALDLSLHGALVVNSLDNVSGTGLTLGADHRCALGNTAESLAEVAATADERHLKVVLVDVVVFVCGGQNLGLVDL